MPAIQGKQENEADLLAKLVFVWQARVCVCLVGHWSVGELLVWENDGK